MTASDYANRSSGMVARIIWRVYRYTSGGIERAIRADFDSSRDAEAARDAHGERASLWIVREVTIYL